MRCVHVSKRVVSSPVILQECCSTQPAERVRTHLLALCREVYDRCSPGFSKRCTAPLLVDTRTRTAVCNDSGILLDNLYAISKLVNPEAIDLKPARLAKEMDELNERVYRNVNNAVYRCVSRIALQKREQCCTQVCVSVACPACPNRTWQPHRHSSWMWPASALCCVLCI